MPGIQGRYWMLTVPVHQFLLYLPPGVAYLKGQMEEGGNTGYRHWQLLAYFPQKVALATVRRVFGDVHAEQTRSKAAEQYVWKDDTAVAGTRFELGQHPGHRGEKRKIDWENAFAEAKAGRFEDVPADLRFRYFGTMQKIAAHYANGVAEPRSCVVYWGPTGVGKSRRAWFESGIHAYPKSPTSKFWDGYRGQANVVIDEFRGQIEISHLLRWLDRYPVLVEIKGSGMPMSATSFWITSNLSPREWYPNVDETTISALERRLRVTNMVENWEEPEV